MSDGWGDWIMHDGAHVPGPLGTPVRVRWETGDIEDTFVGYAMAVTIAAGRMPYGSWLWAVYPDNPVEKIVAYSLRRGIEDELDALREMVEDVFADGERVEPALMPAPAAPDDPTWGCRFPLTGWGVFGRL